MEDATTSLGDTLNNHFRKNQDSVGALYSGKNRAYCVNSPGHNCAIGESNVANFLVAEGGDPNNLYFPCPD